MSKNENKDTVKNIESNQSKRRSDSIHLTIFFTLLFSVSLAFNLIHNNFPFIVNIFLYVILIFIFVGLTYIVFYGTEKY